MTTRRYEIVVRVDADDDLEGGTPACLLAIVSHCLADADLRPVSLQARESPDERQP